VLPQMADPNLYGGELDPDLYWDLLLTPLEDAVMEVSMVEVSFGHWQVRHRMSHPLPRGRRGADQPAAMVGR
jgi:hypothetical protein